MEQRLLNACANSREAFNLADRADIGSALSDQGEIIWKLLSNYYLRDTKADYVSYDLLKERISRDYPKHENIFHTLIDSFDPELSVPNVMDDIIEARKDTIRYEMSSALMAKDDEELHALTEKLLSISAEEGEDDTTFIGVPVTDVLRKSDREHRIAIWPKSLNERVGGGLFRGCNALVFARPETGKSLFCINLTGGLVRQGYRVLYIGNEDTPQQMLPRFVSRISQMPRTEVEKDPEKAQEKCNQHGYDNLIFHYSEKNTMREIYALTEKHSPDVVIIDQLRNVLAKDDNKALQLEWLGQQTRKMAHKYNCVVIGVTQAGESADNKLTLEMGDVEWSNTGIQGAMDLIIGIGVNDDFERKGWRQISISKNKLHPDHSFFQVHYDTLIHAVRSL